MTPTRSMDIIVAAGSILLFVVTVVNGQACAPDALAKVNQCLILNGIIPAPQRPPPGFRPGPGPGFPPQGPGFGPQGPGFPPQGPGFGPQRPGFGPQGQPIGPGFGPQGQPTGPGFGPQGQPAGLGFGPQGQPAAGQQPGFGQPAQGPAFNPPLPQTAPNPNAGTPNPSGSPAVPDADLNRLKALCTNGSFELGIRCIDIFLNDCANNPQIIQALQIVMDPQQMKTGVRLLCGNIAVLEAQSTCITQQRVDIANCERYQAEQLDAKLSALTFEPPPPLPALKPGQQPPLDIVSRLECEFMGELINCQKTAISQNCDKQAGDMLYEYRKAFSPPICKNHLTGWSSSASPRFGNGAIIASVLSVVIGALMK